MSENQAATVKLDQRLLNSVQVEADSINPSGQRITTVTLDLPKTLVAQFNTHSMIRRNSASSRAIPVLKVIEQAVLDPYVPNIVGLAGKGMAPGTYVDGLSEEHSAVWGVSLRNSIYSALLYAYEMESWVAHRFAATLASLAQSAREEGVPAAVRRVLVEIKEDFKPRYAKETANRFLEPFMLTRIIATATEWDSLIQQRADLSHGAQSPIASVAYGIKLALESSEPVEKVWGEAHAPFSEDVKTSVASAAAVSYAKRDASPDLHDRLLAAPHPSPFEHYCYATPGVHRAYAGWESYRLRLEKSGTMPDYNSLAFLEG